MGTRYCITHMRQLGLTPKPYAPSGGGPHRRSMAGAAGAGAGGGADSSGGQRLARTSGPGGLEALMSRAHSSSSEGRAQSHGVMAQPQYPHGLAAGPLGLAGSSPPSRYARSGSFGEAYALAGALGHPPHGSGNVAYQPPGLGFGVKHEQAALPEPPQFRQRLPQEPSLLSMLLPPPRHSQLISEAHYEQPEPRRREPSQRGLAYRQDLPPPAMSSPHQRQQRQQQPPQPGQHFEPMAAPGAARANVSAGALPSSDWEEGYEGDFGIRGRLSVSQPAAMTGVAPALAAPQGLASTVPAERDPGGSNAPLEAEAERMTVLNPDGTVLLRIPMSALLRSLASGVPVSGADERAPSGGERPASASAFSDLTGVGALLGRQRESVTGALAAAAAAAAAAGGQGAPSAAQAEMAHRGSSASVASLARYASAGLDPRRFSSRPHPAEDPLAMAAPAPKRPRTLAGHAAAAAQGSAAPAAAPPPPFPATAATRTPAPPSSPSARQAARSAFAAMVGSGAVGHGGEGAWARETGAGGQAAAVAAAPPPAPLPAPAHRLSPATRQSETATPAGRGASGAASAGLAPPPPPALRTAVPFGHADLHALEDPTEHSDIQLALRIVNMDLALLPSALSLITAAGQLGGRPPVVLLQPTHGPVLPPPPPPGTVRTLYQLPNGRIEAGALEAVGGEGAGAEGAEGFDAGGAAMDPAMRALRLVNAMLAQQQAAGADQVEMLHVPRGVAQAAFPAAGRDARAPPEPRRAGGAAAAAEQRGEGSPLRPPIAQGETQPRRGQGAARGGVVWEERVGAEADEHGEPPPPSATGPAGGPGGPQQPPSRQQWQDSEQHRLLIEALRRHQEQEGAGPGAAQPGEYDTLQASAAAGLAAASGVRAQAGEQPLPLQQQQQQQRQQPPLDPGHEAQRRPSEAFSSGSSDEARRQPGAAQGDTPTHGSLDLPGPGAAPGGAPFPRAQRLVAAPGGHRSPDGGGGAAQPMGPPAPAFGRAFRLQGPAPPPEPQAHHISPRVSSRQLGLDLRPVPGWDRQRDQESRASAGQLLAATPSLDSWRPAGGPQGLDLSAAALQPLSAGPGSMGEAAGGALASPRAGHAAAAQSGQVRLLRRPAAALNVSGGGGGGRPDAAGAGAGGSEPLGPGTGAAEAHGGLVLRLHEAQGRLGGEAGGGAAQAGGELGGMLGGLGAGGATPEQLLATLQALGSLRALWRPQEGPPPQAAAQQPLPGRFVEPPHQQQLRQQQEPERGVAQGGRRRQPYQPTVAQAPGARVQFGAGLVGQPMAGFGPGSRLFMGLGPEGSGGGGGGGGGGSERLEGHDPSARARDH